VAYVAYVVIAYGEIDREGRRGEGLTSAIGRGTNITDPIVARGRAGDRDETSALRSNEPRLGGVDTDVRLDARAPEERREERGGQGSSGGWCA
jgi:hypothetical protein